jgi:hypothetical protein
MRQQKTFLAAFSYEILHFHFVTLSGGSLYAGKKERELSLERERGMRVEFRDIERGTH